MKMSERIKFIAKRQVCSSIHLHLELTFMLANKTFIIFRKGRDKEIQGQLWECGDIENGVADNQIKNTE